MLIEVCGMRILATAVFAQLMMAVAMAAPVEAPDFGQFHIPNPLTLEAGVLGFYSPSLSSSMAATAIFILGVDCGENTLLHSYLRRNLSLFPCNVSNSDLIPYFIAAKMGLSTLPSFYSLNGSIQPLMNGVNLSPAIATHHIQSSIFYLSFGKEDFIRFFLHEYNSTLPSSLRHQSRVFMCILADQTVYSIRYLYDGDVRKILVMSLLPLGCAPRSEVRWYPMNGKRNDTRGCVDWINQLVVEYNKVIEEHVLELKLELPDAHVVYCDVYEGIMENIAKPRVYGFQNERSGCCVRGWHHATSVSHHSLLLLDDWDTNKTVNFNVTICGNHYLMIIRALFSIPILAAVAIGVYCWKSTNAGAKGAGCTTAVGEIVMVTTIDKLVVYENKVLGKGCEGKLVFEGEFDHCPVAVKRVQKLSFDLTEEENVHLQQSGKHSNVLKYFCRASDQQFIYVALELCIGNLAQLVYAYSKNDNKAIKLMEKFGSSQLKLWKPNSFPTMELLELLKGLVEGIEYLHRKRNLQRPLCPENILISGQKKLEMRVCDLNIIRLTDDEVESIQFQHGTRWSAPETLKQGVQNKLSDCFSLGCVIFYCLTKGLHPFPGSHPFMVLKNIIDNKKKLSAIRHIPEAFHLVSGLLNPTPQSRIKLEDVLSHPLFWSAQKRMLFLREVGDRLNVEQEKPPTTLLQALESIKTKVLNGQHYWNQNANILLDRNSNYKGDKLKELIRLIRNRLTHNREMGPTNRSLIQGQFGTFEEGLDAYLTSQFPNLLMELQIFMSQHCGCEDAFRVYC